MIEHNASGGETKIKPNPIMKNPKRYILAMTLLLAMSHLAIMA